MVAYAYAAQWAGDVDRLVLMEAFLPGIGDWNSVFCCAISGISISTAQRTDLPRTFLERFRSRSRQSLSETDREFYAKEYARPDHMKAGMEVFRAFPKDAEDFARLAKTKLSMPLLVLSGEKAGGPFLIEQGRMVATDVEGVLVKGRATG